ncbi:HEPN domain-containing protein [Blautia sp.]
MEGSLKELAGYRMDRAGEMLLAAEENLRIGQYKTSLNRSYYAIFHAMRAANIIKGFDSSKHSGVIAFFNKEYIKNGIMEKSMSVIIKNSSFLREKSDYDDFFIASKKDAEAQLQNAKIFLDAVERYLRAL